MAAKEEAVPKPNIIILLADDLGYNDVSCYRNENFPQQSDSFPTSQTPNLDLFGPARYSLYEFLLLVRLLALHLVRL